MDFKEQVFISCYWYLYGYYLKKAWSDLIASFFSKAV